MSDPATDSDPPKSPSPEAEPTDASPEGAPPKIDPADIELRAKPRPVTRINRRMLGLAVGAVGLLLFGVALVALDPPTFREEAEQRELFRTENTPTPEGLEALPRRYSDLPPPDPPQLGPPLPGDLGQSIVEAERDFGIVLPETSETTFRPDPEADAERAERIRQARLAQQGREAGVFFQISSRPASASAAIPPVVPATAQTLQANTEQDGRRTLELDREADPNLQGRKLDFLNQDVDAAIYNPHALQDPASPYQVMAGTIIPASLITGINFRLARTGHRPGHRARL